MGNTFTLEQVLNTFRIDFSHDKLTFSLVPFTSSQISAWNRAMSLDRREDETAIDHNERTRGTQLAVIASHFRHCLTKGNADKVTAEWVSNEIPQAVLGEFVDYFVNGVKPAFVEGGQGN